jgi:hypothetical protein
VSWRKYEYAIEHIKGLAHKYKTWKNVTDNDLHGTEVLTVLKSLLEQAPGSPWQPLAASGIP